MEIHAKTVTKLKRKLNSNSIVKEILILKHFQQKTSTMKKQRNANFRTDNRSVTVSVCVKYVTLFLRNINYRYIS